MSLTNDQNNGQGTVEAYEPGVEKKCEHYNPFLCDESCANTLFYGEDLFTPFDRPAHFAPTNPFYGADSQSHGSSGRPDVYMLPYPAPNVSLKVHYADTNPFASHIWEVLYTAHQLPNQRQVRSPCRIVTMTQKRLLNMDILR